ncbi:Uncharacterised protein [Vibrio cholerae]|nr:Uncharacterised protein [Vibrio cholerae]
MSIHLAADSTDFLPLPRKKYTTTKIIDDLATMPEWSNHLWNVDLLARTPVGWRYFAHTRKQLISDLLRDKRPITKGNWTPMLIFVIAKLV